MRKRTGLLALTLTAVLTPLLAPTASAATQPDGQWNDPYIKAPRAIAAAAIDSCRYQISFERALVDSRYGIRFEGEFQKSGGAVTTRALTAESGGLALPTGSGSRYTLNNGYALSPNQVDICGVQAAGESLVGFRIKASLDGAYDYTNEYRSTRITPVTTPGSVPTAPKITGSTPVAGTDNLTVTWAPSTGGTQLGYRVIIEKPFYHGGDITWSYVTNTVDTTATSATIPLGTYKPELDRRITVVAFGGNGFASDTAAATEITAKP